MTLPVALSPLEGGSASYPPPPPPNLRSKLTLRPSTLLPLLAALLLALAVQTALPTPASAQQTTVWSATLTVQEIGDVSRERLRQGFGYLTGMH